MATEQNGRVSHKRNLINLVLTFVNLNFRPKPLVMPNELLNRFKKLTQGRVRHTVLGKMPRIDIEIINAPVL